MDTGASDNFISQEIINKLKKVAVKKERRKEITLADGTIALTDGTVRLNTMIDGLTKMEFKVQFDILKSNESNIILGMPFLMENNCKIDLENNMITIDRQ